MGDHLLVIDHIDQILGNLICLRLIQNRFQLLLLYIQLSFLQLL